MATEFGKTFVGDLHAESFPGRSPSCDLAAVPLLRINLKGDTAFEQPPMLEMVVADFEQSVVRAAQSLAPVLTYAGTEPGVVAVGEIHEETRPNGHLAYVQFQEDCRLHPNGYKTSLKGLARRGATQLSFELLLALDSVATVSIAEEILANFDSLDIAALTE
ncbi:MAG: hypothetical protein R3F41_12020 [Gammaproteobacteria bacterium]|nr:hypothetical protein [Pseudomonadales bacterium]MCP5348822.1 hypothetical protein [Pseudomonadales bacterium]